MSAVVINGYTITQPNDPDATLGSVAINQFEAGDFPWQAQIYGPSGGLRDAEYFASETEALRWSTSQLFEMLAEAAFSDELSNIRAAVKDHDDKLNDEEQPSGAQVPTGDDYNDIHTLIMDGAPRDFARDNATALFSSLDNIVNGVFATTHDPDDEAQAEAISDGQALIAAIKDGVPYTGSSGKAPR